MTETEFSTVYRECSPKLLRLLRSQYGLREELAEELASKVWLQAWRFHDRYDSSKALPITWIANIARSVVDSHFRAVRVRRTYSIGIQFDREGAYDIVDNRTDIAESAALHDMHERLRDSLTPEQLPILDAWLSGRNDIEIGEAVGLPSGSVHWHRNRIREIAAKIG